MITAHKWHEAKTGWRREGNVEGDTVCRRKSSPFVRREFSHCGGCGQLYQNDRVYTRKHPEHISSDRNQPASWIRLLLLLMDQNHLWVFIGEGVNVNSLPANVVERWVALIVRYILEVVMYSQLPHTRPISRRTSARDISI